MKPGLNDKCFCNSGKLYKHCCYPKKPRINVIDIKITSQQFEAYANDHTLNVELLIDDINNNANIKDSITQETISESGEYITKGYKGEKRFKAIFQVPKDMIAQNQNELEIFFKFDTIFSIDTNEVLVKGVMFSLGAAFQFKYNPSLTESPVTAFLIKLFEAEKDSTKPENSNWQKLIEFIRHHKQYRTDSKIAIIVDSDLGQLQDYNNRIKPLYKDFFLPENFTLIYATADKKDSLLNLMIRLPDHFLNRLSNLKK